MSNLSWKTVEEIGARLNASTAARAKWRQRGVPPAWRIKIVQDLMASGTPVSLGDFDKLTLTGDKQEMAA